MKLAELPSKISGIVVARSFCNLPNALLGLLQQQSRLGHTAFNNPLFYAPSSFRLH
jgi:hypothetical protein